MEVKHDWQEVADLQPRGYVELNNGKQVLHGPVVSVTINEMDMVVIETKWQAVVSLDGIGLPAGGWEVVADSASIIFPNFMVPYVIEDTPEKGLRVRFGFNILYLSAVEGLDPSRVKGLIP